LVVDGHPRAVRSFDGTVAELLEAEGVALGSHDRVAPGPAASLADGMQVQVLQASEVTVVLNGQRRDVWVRGDATVAEVLDRIDLEAGPQAYLEPSRGATVGDGDTIVFREPLSLRLTLDGEARDVITNAASVGELLDSLGVVLDRNDRVTPGVRTRLADRMDIHVVRVNVRTATVEEPIPFQVEVRHSDSMTVGQEGVTQAGRPGLRRSVYRVRTEDGVEVSRSLISAHTVEEPVSQVLVKGTRPVTSQVGQATWYERDGMVAAHKTLPFGTEVTVTNLANGRQVTVVINDRGPYGDGRIIDLSDDAFTQLAPLGAGVIDVHITW
jgi:uncharacterized protein YabE (DUF348 family)